LRFNVLIFSADYLSSGDNSQLTTFSPKTEHMLDKALSAEPIFYIVSIFVC